MKRLIICIFAAILLVPAISQAQDNKSAKAVTFDLDEEKLTIEADIPSVDLILSFREIQERNNGMRESFLDEIVDTAKEEPF